MSEKSPDHANVRPSSVLTTTEYWLPSLGRVVNLESVTLIGPRRRWNGFLRSRSVNPNWPSSIFNSSIITSGNAWLVAGAVVAGVAVAGDWLVSRFEKLNVPSANRMMLAD